MTCRSPSFTSDRVARGTRAVDWRILGCVAVAVLALATVCPALAQARVVPQMPPEQQPAFVAVRPGEFIAGRLLVRFRPGTGEAARRAAAQAAGARTLRRLDALNAVVLTVRSGREQVALDRLRTDPAVIDAERDPIDHGEAIATCTPSLTCPIPDDPLFASQWGLSAIEAPQAWAITQGSPNVTVAVVDSGIDISHPDLSGKIIGSATLTANAGNVYDRAGHGTHVAGIIAAIPNNGVGVAGDGYNTTLLNLKASADSSSATSPSFSCEAIAQSIVYAVDHSAQVVNLSLGSPTPCDLMASAVAYAWNHDVLIIAAAGNENTSAPVYPAAFPDVIAVAATDQNDQRASFSNYGASWVDIAAPGADILSTVPTYSNPTGQTSYAYMSGTSMAAPFVAGAAALIWPTISPTVTPGAVNRAVAARLCATANPIAGTGQYWSCGLLDLCQAAAGAPSSNCTPTASAPATPTPPAPAPPTLTTPQPPGPSTPVAPAPAPVPTPRLPQLTKSQAHQHLHSVFRETFAARFTHRRGYHRRCARRSSIRFQCTVAWSYRDTYYYGTTTIYNTLYKETIAWNRNATIHWVNSRCRRAHAATQRRCTIHTIRL